MSELDGLDSAAADLLDEISPTKSESDPTLVEALKRIEEANLFYTLIKTDIFKDSSARPDILNSVNSKIKQFAKSELNKLLNISQPGAQPENSILSIPKDELLALRVLAAKVLKKDPDNILKSQSIKTPQINTIAATPIASINIPEVNNVPTPPAVVQDDPKLSGSSTTPPSPAQKEAARKALLAKANKRRAEQASSKKDPATATLPAGGHQGYAKPAGYVPPPQQVVHSGQQPVTAQGLNVSKLVGEIMGNSQSVATLSDAPMGGDPNARL
jgi:hypothetical protein